MNNQVRKLMLNAMFALGKSGCLVKWVPHRCKWVQVQKQMMEMGASCNLGGLLSLIANEIRVIYVVLFSSFFIGKKAENPLK